MSFISKKIKIDDWCCNILYIGDYDNKQVDKILDANRCNCKDEERENCPICNGTGYSGDIEVAWVDESDKDDCNVYEYINY